VPPGGGPPPHIHTREDETFYLLEGQIEFLLGEETIVAGAGDFVNVPRGTVHRFRNTGTETARMVLTFTPAGIERWFEETLEPAPNGAEDAPDNIDEVGARYVAAAPRYGLGRIRRAPVGAARPKQTLRAGDEETGHAPALSNEERTCNKRSSIRSRTAHRRGLASRACAATKPDIETKLGGSSAAIASGTDGSARATSAAVAQGTDGSVGRRGDVRRPPRPAGQPGRRV
jgi:hypothetical protein